MRLKEKTIEVKTLENLPSIQEIKSIPRGLTLKIIFGEKTQSVREAIGEEWKSQLPKFSVRIHMIKNEIYICKLITDEEIEQHQLFFENCAKEYGQLAEQLITQFMEEFNVESHRGFPLRTLNPFGKKHYDQTGKMGKWRYFFHGSHCRFTHLETNQTIEVPMTYGKEYGQLDPFFFSIFIKTTPKFQPLPIETDNYSDWRRVLIVMEKIGKFEQVTSNIEGQTGFIVKDRVKHKVEEIKNGFNKIITKNLGIVFDEE